MTTTQRQSEFGEDGVVAGIGGAGAHELELRARLAVAAARAALGDGDVAPAAVVDEVLRLDAATPRGHAERFAPGLFAGLAAGVGSDALLELARRQSASPPPTPHDLGRMLEEGRTEHARRKRSGSWYTSRALARATTRRALDGTSRPTVLDPACGGGAFLLEALDLRGPRGEAAVHGLHGLDLDPLAVDCTRAALWLAAGAGELPVDAFHHGVRCGNALLGLDGHALDFPVDALARRAGDAAHPAGAGHAPGSWDRALADAARGLRRARPTGSLPRDVDGADRWSALWFWDADRLEHLPSAADWPTWSAEALAQARELVRRERFFHRELEWPEVEARGGFDAIVGNPPWEVDRPDAREWFSQLDPGYRELSRGAARARQVRLFRERPELERAWLVHNARQRARAHWAARRDSVTRGERQHHALFLERSLAWLRPGGRLALLVPAGIAGDRRQADLRRLLLDEHTWEWLFQLENRRGLFDIHRSFAFCAVVVRRGGRTERLRVSFGRDDVSAWERAEDHAHVVTRASLARTSPRHGAFVPFRRERDRALHERMLERAVPLADSDWGVRYRREVDLTQDARHFVDADGLARRGARLDRSDRAVAGPWRRGPAPAGAILARDGDGWCAPEEVTGVWLPLYQGSMVHLHEYAAKGWDGARWRPGDRSRIEPRVYLAEELYRERRPERGPKLCLRDVARATDARSLIASLVPDLPCANVLPVLELDGSPALLAAVLGALVTDWACRQRLAGAHLNWHLLEELPVLPRAALEGMESELEDLVWSLLAPHPLLPRATGRGGAQDRARLEALVAAALGLALDDLAWILRDCGRPRAHLPAPDLDPRGFWRVDRELPPERRSTTLALAAFRSLRAAPEPSR